MVKRKPKAGSRPVGASPVPFAQAQDSANAPIDERRASPRVQFVATTIIAFHFVALIIALSANLAPSYLQGRLTHWLAPYLVTTNQDYGAIPLELTHADPIDFPLLIELHRSGDEPLNWKKISLPPRWFNVSRLIRLIAIDQPESEILSEIAAQAVSVAERKSGRKLDAIRFAAPKILSYDEDEIVASGQGALIDNELNPQIVFSARIIRDASDRVLLVPQQDPLRTSKPAPTEGVGR